MIKHWSWCPRMFCTQLMTFLLLTAAQENAKSTGVFWSKRDSGIVSWCHPCQSEGTTTAWMDLHHWSCNCDGRTLVPHFVGYTLPLCFSFAEHFFGIAVSLNLHLFGTLCTTHESGSPEQLYGVPKQERRNTSVLQLQKMISEVARAPLVNLCLVFSSSIRVNGQVPHTQIPLASEICCFQTHFYSKKLLAHQVSRTMRKRRGKS